MKASKLCRIGIALLALLAAWPALADSQFRVRRMMRNDVPPGKGQCDIRLQVDQEAEVSLRGESVFIRNIAGREPRDDGSECNAPFPGGAMQGFNFEVKDSRGEIRLVAEPSRRTNFAAVVYIRDSSGGEGRYHFRISWALGGGPPVMEPGRPAYPPERPSGPPERRGGFVWNDVMTYRGEGRGTVTFGGSGGDRLFGCVLDIDRRGRLTISFRMEGGRSLALSGTVVDREGERLRADVTSSDRFHLSGPMFLTLDRRREVSSVTFEGGGGRERMRVTWDRR